MKINSKIIREILEITDEELKEKLSRNTRCGQNTINVIYEGIQNNSKRFFGWNFPDILNVRKPSNLKQDIKRFMERKISSFELCTQSGYRKRSGKFILFIYYYFFIIKFSKDGTFIIK